MTSRSYNLSATPPRKILKNSSLFPPLGFPGKSNDLRSSFMSNNSTSQGYFKFN